MSDLTDLTDPIEIACDAAEQYLDRDMSMSGAIRAAIMAYLKARAITSNPAMAFACKALAAELEAKALQ